MSETLGLIGGLGPGATIHYYRELTARPISLVIAHADMDRVRDHVRKGELLPLARYFAETIDRLRGAGATLAAIGAVAPHVCQHELAGLSPLPLVSIVDETASEIRTRGLRRVALFGSRYAIESSLFGALGDVEVAMPRSDEIQSIHRSYFEIVEAGEAGAGPRDVLTALARTLVERDRVDAIVLAGTELALLFDEKTAPFPAVDCTRIHLDAILKRMG